MATRRITYNISSPATEFLIDGDWAAIGRFDIYQGAVNRGNSGSNYGNRGYQHIAIDGLAGQAGIVDRTPFLPSGYPTGATRWFVGPHLFYPGSPAGGMTLRQTLFFNNTPARYDVSTAFVPSFPPAPSPLGFDQIAATSMRYRFSGNGDGGNPMVGWEAMLSTRADFATVVAHVVSSGTTVFTGLNPGTTYYARARGRNGVGLGDWSTVSVGTTLSGARVFSGGSYKHAIAYVFTGGAWRRAIPHVYKDGAWRLPQ